MGAFERSGTFRDRARFLEGLRERLTKLTGGAAQGMTETWEKAGDADVARLSGFGVKIELTVEEQSWRCEAQIPDWLPIPQKMIEAKFDEKFSELSEL